MKAPKILPWVAKRAGISEELALKLWRRAAGEAEFLTGRAEGSEYWGLVVQRFLNLVEDEAGASPHYDLAPSSPTAWMWHHQTRVSLLSLMAVQNAYQLWQETWQKMILPKQVA